MIALGFLALAVGAVAQDVEERLAAAEAHVSVLEAEIEDLEAELEEARAVIREAHIAQAQRGYHEDEIRQRVHAAMFLAQTAQAEAELFSLLANECETHLDTLKGTLEAILDARPVLIVDGTCPDGWQQFIVVRAEIFEVVTLCGGDQP